MKVLCLGAGNAFAPGDLGWNGFLIDNHVLLDAPPDCLARLHRLGVEPSSIDTVLISHFHADHFSGLPALMLHMSIRDRRSARLTIVGPPGVEGRVEDLSVAMGIRKRDRGNAFERRYIEVEDGTRLDVAGFRVTAREMRHSPSLRAFGYRLSDGGRTLAYSGDTTLCPGLIELVNGADMAIVECSSSAAEDPAHMNLALMRELRASLGRTPRLLITHRDMQVSAEDIENADVAGPGERYTV